MGSEDEIIRQLRREILEWKRQCERVNKEKHDLLREIEGLRKIMYLTEGRQKSGSGQKPKTERKSNRKKGG